MLNANTCLALSVNHPSPLHNYAHGRPYLWEVLKCEMKVHINTLLSDTCYSRDPRARRMRRTGTRKIPVPDYPATWVTKIVTGKLQVDNRTEIGGDLACAIVPSLVFQQTKSISDCDQMAILQGITLFVFFRMLAQFPCIGRLPLSVQRFDIFSHLFHTTFSYLG